MAKASRDTVKICAQLFKNISRVAVSVYLFKAYLYYIKKRESPLRPVQNDALVYPKYIVPYIQGQGLNNQLWEYRSSAIIAKATNRFLCLEPFHRFYLDRKGREFLPFEELFDVEKLKEYVPVVLGGGICARACGANISHHIEIGSKLKKRTKPFPIAEWRPGSLTKFKRSTGFRNVPNPTLMDANDMNITVPSYINLFFSKFDSGRCISVSGTIPTLSNEYLLWSRGLEVTHKLKQAVSEIQKSIFGDRQYLAIHWRFEETKCSGMGRGIGFGRALGEASRSNTKTVRKSDEHADLCFFAGPFPKTTKKVGYWLRLVSKSALINWIQLVLQERQLKDIYLATDCHDSQLLEWMKKNTGAISKSDILPILKQYISLGENDIVSRVEQQICAEAKVFAGTLTSSWTSSVIEERFKTHQKFFTQDKYNIIRRPDPQNQTFYIDVEACNCDWE